MPNTDKTPPSKPDPQSKEYDKLFTLASWPQVEIILASNPIPSDEDEDLHWEPEGNDHVPA